MSKFGFGKKADEFNALKKQAAVQIMARTKQYFGDAFEKEALGDEKWTEVARRTQGNRFNEKQIIGGKNKPSGKNFIVDQGDDYATRKILSGTTGRLKYKTEKADSSISPDGTTSVMINPVPYASAMFEGSSENNVPARPNMKQTGELTGIQLTILKVVTNKIWKIK